MSELVSFETEDGIEIVGDLYPSDGSRFALLLHMMPATKESWRALCDRLVSAGYTCLAIDLRGHGESTMAGSLHFRKFTDEQHQASMLDAEAAFAWLKGKGATETNTIAIGASIGANLALGFMARHGLPTAVALSPGLDYHGVTTEPAVRALVGGQKAILVASDDDPEAWEATRALHALNAAQTVLIETHDLGHGTRMFDKDPALMDRLLALL